MRLVLDNDPGVYTVRRTDRLAPDSAVTATIRAAFPRRIVSAFFESPFGRMPVRCLRDRA